jgi:hypothetical protein
VNEPCWFDAAGQMQAMPFKWSRSTDAMIALIKRELPGWAWKVASCSVSDDAWLLPDFNCPVHGERLRREFGDFKPGSIWDTGIDIDRRPSGQPALAMVEAFCRAKHEKEMQDAKG